MQLTKKCEYLSDKQFLDTFEDLFVVHIDELEDVNLLKDLVKEMQRRLKLNVDSNINDIEELKKAKIKSKKEII